MLARIKQLGVTRIIIGLAAAIGAVVVSIIQVCVMAYFYNVDWCQAPLF